MDANTIAAGIRQAIVTEEYVYGDRLPTVRELAERHGVSTPTASAAYAVLAAMGFVKTDKRHGTKVIAGPVTNAHLGHFPPPDLSAAEPWKPAVANQETTSATYLVEQKAAPAYMADWGIPAGARVVERHRVRSVNGIPVQHKLSVFPYEVAMRVPAGYTDAPPLLAPVGAPDVHPPKEVRYADWMGWDIANTECVITAEPLRPYAADALGVPQASPGFQIASTARDSSGAVLYVSVTTTQLHHRVTLNIIG